ncbi:hypothetical protein [Flavobacterium sp. LB1P71]|uniref:hypothetical protein n=1 Tax=Flavobacterium sp. LB1P71 TaxID=3401716 RepID=UPI003AAE9FC6
MGFFKSIGNKLKRVVSVKNLVNGVTGNFSAVGADVVRVASSEDPKRKVTQPVNTLTQKGSVLSTPVVDMLANADKTYQDNLIKSVAELKPVQDANTWFAKLFAKSQWEKYKNWIIGFGAVVSVFVLWKFVFSKKQNTRKRR